MWVTALLWFLWERIGEQDKQDWLVGIILIGSWYRTCAQLPSTGPGVTGSGEYWPGI